MSVTPNRTFILENRFTPWGEFYGYLNGYNGFFAGMLGITANGAMNDSYEAAYRLYNEQQGRWVSPDPAGLSAVDITRPQSWNRYVYVGNDPLNNTDPSGLICRSVVDPVTQQKRCAGPNDIYVPQDSPPAALGGTANLPSGGHVPGSGGGVTSNRGISSASLARCAAAKASSLASLIGLPESSFWAQAFLGNDFATATNILLGPERGTSAFEALVSNPTPINATALVISGAGRTVVQTGGLVTKETPGGAPYAAAKTLPIAKTVAGKLLLKGFVVFSAAKLVYDGAAFGIAELQCAGSIQ